MSEDASLKARAAAFEQWSGGGGNPHAEWIITRVEAAHVFGALRGRIARLEARLAEVTAERDENWHALQAAGGDRALAEGRAEAAEAQLAVARRGLATIAADDPPVNSAAYRAGKEGLRQLARSYLAQLDGEQRG